MDDVLADVALVALIAAASAGAFLVAALHLGRTALLFGDQPAGPTLTLVAN